MGYLLLAVAIVAEVIGTIALPLTRNFTRLGPSIIVVAGYGLAFFMLSLVVRTIPVAIVYALWSGIGVALVTIASAIWLRQRLDFAGIMGVSLIVAGVVVINLFSNSRMH